jgi:aspartate ammonia-lyase
VMMPVIVDNMLWSLHILGNAMDAFTIRCVAGITANAAVAEAYAFKSASLVTALAPYIGYLRAAEIAKKQVETKRDIREIVREYIANGSIQLSDADLDEILRPEAMTEPGIAGQGKVRAPVIGSGGGGG